MVNSLEASKYFKNQHNFIQIVSLPCFELPNNLRILANLQNEWIELIHLFLSRQ
jgi:hypothetical protein